MQPSTVVLLVMLGYIIVLMAGWLPFSIANALMAVAMSFFVEEIPISNIYAGFANSTLPLIAGMCIIGQALFETGVAGELGQKVCNSRVGKSEKLFICVISVIVTIQSAFMSNNGTIAMWMPLIATIAAGSNGRIRSKMVIFPAGTAAVVGGACTLVGSSAQQVPVNTMLMETPGFEAGMSVFEMTKVMWPALILQVLFWATIGYTLLEKVLCPESADFNKGNVYAEENFKQEDADKAFGKDVPKWKKILSLVMLVLCIVGFALTDTEPWKNYLNIATVPILGALVLFLTGVIKPADAWKKLPLDLLVGAGFSIALASAVTTTGAGQVMADAIFSVTGTDLTPFAILLLFAVVGAFMTLFMSNTVAGTVLTPLALALAAKQGISPMPYIVVIAAAINLAIATPIGTPVNQLILAGGYKPMDYLKIGGPLWVILVAMLVIMARLVYPAAFV